MWTCPACGRHFANVSQWHSCASVPLDEHFTGTEAHVRELFDRFLAEVEKHGPYELHSVKTRIGVLVRMTFAELVPRRRFLRGHLILTHPAEGPPFTRVETFSPTSHRCIFVLRDPADLDARFLTLLAESYRVGEQRHPRRR